MKSLHVYNPYLTAGYIYIYILCTLPILDSLQKVESLVDSVNIPIEKN